MLALVVVLVFIVLGIVIRPLVARNASFGLWWWARLCPFVPGVPGVPGLFAGRYCRTMGDRALLSSPRPARYESPWNFSLPPRKAVQRCNAPCPVSAPDLRWATQPGCLYEKVQPAFSSVSSPFLIPHPQVP